MRGSNYINKALTENFWRIFGRMVIIGGGYRYSRSLTVHISQIFHLCLPAVKCEQHFRFMWFNVLQYDVQKTPMDHH